MKGRVARAVKVVFALIAVSACVCSAVILSLCAGAVSLNFNAVFYYVVYLSPTNEASAASVSSLVHSYGGAGYIIENDGKYYVTLSCYYSAEKAEGVCKNLNNSGMGCTVISAEAAGYSLSFTRASLKTAYESNLNTLLNVSEICYSLSNSLDDLSVNQNGAKEILNDIGYSLKGLLKNNSDNCFTDCFEYLICEWEDVSSGYIFAYDVRRLQIAICNALVNIKIY